MAAMDIDWNAALVEQLESHWKNQLRPRMDGLTDAEYFWEPVPGCWSVRSSVAAVTPAAMGGGEFVLDYAKPPRVEEPVTTIAWRLAHIIVGLFGARAAAHFGGPAVAWDTWEYAGTADEALRQLDQTHDAWITGVRSLGTEGLIRPCGPAEGRHADYSMAAIVLHINREVIHHGAEISLLRDLYLWKGSNHGL